MNKENQFYKILFLIYIAKFTHENYNFLQTSKTLPKQQNY